MSLADDFDQILVRARAAGVLKQILTGDCLSGSREVQALALEHGEHEHHFSFQTENRSGWFYCKIFVSTDGGSVVKFFQVKRDSMRPWAVIPVEPANSRSVLVKKVLQMSTVLLRSTWEL